MKAAIRSGANIIVSGNIIFSTNYEKPVCGPNNLLIRVKAASINPVDYKVGWPLMGTVVGVDFAGMVEEKGSDVEEDFNVGDEVYGSADKNGTLAEFTIARPCTIALKPQSLSFVEAASLNCAYTSTLQGLRDFGKIQSGDRVLIIGASGGCGTAAVQLARSFGAKEIVGVCSGRNAELVKSLGATDIIDYTKQTIKEFCQNDNGDIEEDQKFDIVFDAATGSGHGEDYKNTSMELLKTETERHGQYVAINGSTWYWLRRISFGLIPNQHLVLYNLNGMFDWICNPNPADDLQCLARIIDENKIKPLIGEVLEFNGDNVEKGFRLLCSRRAVGKIVFRMD